MSEEKEIKIKKKKKFSISNVIVLLLCVVVLVCGTYFNVEGSNKDKEFEKVKEIKNEISAKRYKNISGVALINVGKENNVRNMSLLLFPQVEETGRVLIMGIAKDDIDELCFRSDPKKMYKRIKEKTGANVSNYIIYNNDTLKELLDIQLGTKLSVHVDKKNDIDDVSVINKNAPRYAKQYGIEEFKTITEEGYQDFDTPGFLAFANMYYDREKGNSNVWRRSEALYAMLINIHSQSLDDIKKTWQVISKCKNDINDARKYDITAAIKQYGMDKIQIWPK